MVLGFKYSLMSDSPNSSGLIEVGLQPQPTRRWVHLPHSRRRRILFVVVYLVFCWGLAVTGIKLFWLYFAGVPLAEAVTTWDIYYPKLRQSGLHDASLRHDDDRFDVLLLGGSVLEDDWGSVERRLTARLRATIGDRFRVINLASQGHTSRDSLLKYWQLAGQQFEVVIVYDGINDVRMNCCPRELFRDDYTHCSWYHDMQKHIDAGTIAAPARLRDQAGLVHATIFLQFVDDHMREFGREIKTDRTIRQNLAEIVNIAAARGDAVVLSTFAYHIPEDYSDERFASHALDYSYRPDGASCGATLWGKPEYVAATIDAQNDVIRDLAAQHPEVSFIDQRELMPGEGWLFVDPCHCSEAGSQRLVDNFWPVIERRLGDWKAARAAMAR